MPEPNAAETVVNVVLAPDDHRRMANLCGQFDEHIHQIERRLGLSIKSRGNHFELTGSEAAASLGARVLQDLFAVTEHELVDAERVHMTLIEQANLEEEPGTGDLIIHARRRDVRARGANQIAYTRAMRTRDLVFGIGPAGTGKTYLAVAAAVEAGERLGFLPGDMSQKVDPYLRPMYDALYEMLGFERVGKLIDRHIIEIAPLAFMRGRTLNESFIILDEAQNTTAEQMKMFLTRIGFGSRAVVTGDVTQTDLPRGRESGLNHVTRVLDGVEGVEFVHFGPKDVVRHPLVQSIVAAYAKDEARRPGHDEPGGGGT